MVMVKESNSVSKRNLRDRGHLETYLRDRLKKGQAEFYVGLREAVKAQEGGLAELARRTGLVRAGLYKALSENGNPSFKTITMILDALGVDRTIAMNAPATGETLLKKNTKVVAVEKSPGRPPVKKNHEQPKKTRIMPGSAKGMTYYMSDDFNAPLEEFKEYA